MERTSDQEPPADWWYFHDASFYWATESECALRQDQPDRALFAATNSLDRIDPTNVHNYSATLTFQSEALIRQGEITEACRTLTEVVRLTAERAGVVAAVRLGHQKRKVIDVPATYPQ